MTPSLRLAKREIFQIPGHHYGIGAAVICDRYRGSSIERRPARSACPLTLAMNGSPVPSTLLRSGPCRAVNCEQMYRSWSYAASQLKKRLAF
jgi:hypothetical protein